MAGYETPRAIATSWLTDTPTRKRLATMYGTQGGLFSYGDHFPIAWRHDEGFLVTECTASVTTARHVRATKMALKAAGYAPTNVFDARPRAGQRLDGTPSHRLWVKRGDPRAVTDWRLGAHGVTVLGG